MRRRPTAAGRSPSFETRFQLAWAVAGLIPVVVVIPGRLGFLIVGLFTSAAAVNYIAGARASSFRRMRRPRRRQTPEGRPLPPPRP